MSLWSDLVGYEDANGLIAPFPIKPGERAASNNGVMYTSEAIVLLKKLDELDTAEEMDLFSNIRKCISKDGVLNRLPIGQGGGQEGPDDYYALLNACINTDIMDIPRNILSALLKYKGCLNNENPGQWTSQSFLIRQPQLLASIIAAAYPKKIHILLRLLAFPLFLYSACIIATAGILAPKSEVDNRRLTWHLLQTLRPISIMACIASFFWYRRLYKDYGPEGMRAVAKLYYQVDHPFTRYWID